MKKTYCTANREMCARSKKQNLVRKVWGCAFGKTLALSLTSLLAGCVSGGLFSSGSDENNIPLASKAEVKIFSFGASREQFALRTESGSPAFMPVDKASQTAPLATTIVDMPLSEGGFSASTRVFNPRSGQVVPHQFWTITDRGPNMELKGRKDRKGNVFGAGERFFPLPNYNQGIFKIGLNANGTFEVLARLSIQRAGHPVNGLPSSVSERSTKEAAYKTVREKSAANELQKTPYGYDFEGLRSALDAEGNLVFWASEEYGPSVVLIDARGNIVREYLPGAKPSESKADSVQSPAVFPLPALLRQRKDNRGFEGLAVTTESVFALVQSPLDPAGGRSGQPGSGNKNTRLQRLVRIHKATGSVDMFAYNHIANPLEFGLEHADVKIGDLAVLNAEGTKFLVYEHDGEKKLARFYLATLDADTTKLEEAKGVAYEAGTEPYKGLKKQLVWDFAAQLKSLPVPGKLEGLEVVDSSTLLVMFDNDFCFNTENGFIFPLSAEQCRNTVAEIKFDKPIF